MIELIIVVAIIGLLSAVVLIAIEESREKSRNAARVTQVKEYQKAFELYYSGTGHYPRNGSGASSQMCLGDYSDDACWQSGSSILERAAIADAIVPQFMSRLPEGENTIFGEGSGATYEGLMYIHQDYGKAYTIRYFIEGNDRSCVIDGATGSNLGVDTLCTLVVSP